MSDHHATWKWPKRLFIVRHGQSSGNVARDLAEKRGLTSIDIEERDMDVPLSKLGASQSMALGHWIDILPDDLRPTCILVSPYLRAFQTAEIALRNSATGRHLVPTVDERLREREFGLISGLTKLGIERSFPQEAQSYGHLKKFYYRPPGGESWCDVILRLRSVLDTLSRDYAGQSVMIVCHTVVVNCLRYLFDHLDEKTILKLDAENEIANCAVTTYIAADARSDLKLESYNVVGHLRTQNAVVTRQPDKRDVTP